MFGTPQAWLHIVGVPFLFLFVGVFARRLGRRDGDDSPRANDWAVSTSILLMALGTVAADFRSSCAPSDKSALFYWYIGFLLIVFVSVDHDRFRSWKRMADGKPDKQKRPWVGIVLPDLATMLIYAVYQSQKVS